MEELFNRFCENLVGRLHGPLTMRLILQPLMVSFFAIRSGLKDAREGKPVYFWTMLTNADSRRDLMRDGWKDIGKVFVIAIVLDVVYQLITVRRVYPLETLVVAILLAIVPYLLVRGMTNRIARLGRPKVPHA